MELLAPAGDWDALVAALTGGADAVYLGLTELNARRAAANFDGEALVRAADACHERDVRLYVTVNTLVKQSELPLLERVAGQLSRAGADGAIVQDLGAAAALKRMLPDLALHASTQMALHNPQGVRFARQFGISRAVLARELTFGEIAACAREGVEIEVFAHGALCVSCSGQCLFSSMVGGRSGNRGLCAQPCRLPYRLEGPSVLASGELLSAKDLMALTHLDELKRAGVASLKLEGRLKGPDYVYAVTSVYRRALDGERVDGDLLRRVFNRGYTAGYGPGVVDSELISDPSQRHVLPGTGAFPAPRPRTVPLTGRLVVRAGAPLFLSLSDGLDEVQVAGETAKRAERLPADPLRMAAQIQKTGGTPYLIERLETDVDLGAFAGAAALNALRRDALKALGAKRVERRRGCGRAVSPLNTHPQPIPSPRPGDAPCAGKPRLCVQSSDAQLLKRALDWGADEAVWSPSDVTDEGLARLPDVPFTLALPPVLAGGDLDRVHRWAAEQPLIAGTVLTNAAHLALDWPGETRAGYAMNVTNALSAACLHMPYAPSLELTAAEIRALPGECELVVYGRVALMQLRHCPLNAALKGGRHADCRRCDRGGRYDRGGRGDRSDVAVDGYELVDRRRARFPLERLKTGSGCVVRVLGNVPLMLLRHVERLPDAARWRVIVTRETPAQAEAVVRCHRAALDGEDFRALAGWAVMDAMPSTTGHYFRGVE